MTSASRMQEYLGIEAGEYVDAIERAARDLRGGATDLTDLQRQARALSGLARLAADERLQRAADAIARAMRSAVPKPDADPDVGDRLLASVADLRALLEPDMPEDEAEAHAAAVVGDWADVSSIDDEASAEEVAAPDFGSYVAQETAGIANTIERGVLAFGEDPSNREWIGTILRRQRPLLGAARLDEVAIVAEALHAVEDLAELIIRLDVPVKSEWLDVFRTALEVMRASSEALAEGNEPGPTPALSRLRTLHTELTERYRDQPPAELEAPQPSTAGAESVEAAQVQELRRRAARLRDRIEPALAGDPATVRALDELHTLFLSILR